MNHLRLILFCGFVAAATTACSSTSANAPRVDGTIRQSLKASGLNDVSVSQDLQKGVVTLTGKVQTDQQKAQAESIARGAAGGQVVADEVAVIPNGEASEARSIDSDLDKGIENNLEAALIQNSLDKEVKYSVKNGVVMLTGNVHSQSRRDQAAQIASTVPNVQQVVNEVQVTNQRATASRQ